VPVRRAEPGDASVPCLTVLAHPDPEWVGARAVLRELAAGRAARLSRLEPPFLVPGAGEARPLADPFVSRQPWRLEPRGERGLRLERGDSKTALAVAGEPVAARHDLERGDLERGTVLLLAGRVALLLHVTSAAPLPAAPDYGLVGDSLAMVRLRQEIGQVADFDTPILLRGETGTGKERVAGALPQASRRRHGPYLAINMAAVPPSLAAAELFGAARGAFTGAVRRQEGYFERAAGGTLFLDEVGEMPAEVQALLLRALETRQIQPVGGGEPREIDVRLIAATDADLEGRIGTGDFRAPLLYRLNGYEILLPPLRRRRDDVGRLFFHFLRQELRAAGAEHRLAPPPERDEPWMPAAVVARLAVHDWPGNVRELRNVAQQLVVAYRAAPRAALSSQVERLLAGQRDTVPRETVGENAAPPPSPRRRSRKPSEVDEDEMIAVLRAHRWQVKAAARELGISRASLYLLMDRSPRIRKAADLGADEIAAGRARHGDDLAAMAAELEVSEDGLRQRLRLLGRE